MHDAGDDHGDGEAEGGADGEFLAEFDLHVPQHADRDYHNCGGKEYVSGIARKRSGKGYGRAYSLYLSKCRALSFLRRCQGLRAIRMLDRIALYKSEFHSH